MPQPALRFWSLEFTLQSVAGLPIELSEAHWPVKAVAGTWRISQPSDVCKVL